MSQVFSSKFLAVFAVSWLFCGCVESGSDSDGLALGIAVTPGQVGGAETPENPGDSGSGGAGTGDNSGSLGDSGASGDSGSGGSGTGDNSGTSGDSNSGGAGTGDNSGTSGDNAGTSGDSNSGGSGTPEKPGDSSDNVGTSGDTNSGGSGTGDNAGTSGDNAGTSGDNAGSSGDNAGTSGDTNSGGAGTGDPNGGSVNQKQGEPAVAIESERIPNLHRVSDDLYRSGFPREGGLVELESLGVKSILELSYFDIDSNLPDAKTTSLHIVHYPLLPLGIEQLMIFEMFDIYRDLEKPVLVHCYHGSDRTGLFVAIYRILYQNWSKEEAKDELINGGFGYHDVFTDVIAAIDDLDVEALREAVFGKEMNR